MRILFIADPPDTFKLYKDTTYTMMREADARGHALAFCLQSDLLVRDGAVQAKARQLTLVKPMVEAAVRTL